MEEIFFSICRNNKTFYGVFDFIDIDAPVVIYCPGMNSVRSDVHRIAVKTCEELNKNHISFIRFDYTGLGISDGFFYEMTYEEKFQDILCVYHILLEQYALSPNKVLFAGFSDGAKLALKAAVICKANLILWSPILVENKKNGDSKERIQLSRNHNGLPVIPNYGLGFGIEYYKVKKSFDIEVIQLLNEFNDELIVVYGQIDDFVFETRQQCDRIFSCKKSSIKEIEGAEHIFTNPVWERKVICGTVDWIRSIYFAEAKKNE